MPEQSFRIRAAPALDFVMPETTVCYEIERVGSQDGIDGLQFEWCRIDDPVGREPPGQVRRAWGPLGDLLWGPTSGPQGQGEKRWYCDGWKGPGEHLILCEVVENGARYQLRYPQRVDDIESVLSKPVAVPMHAEDPLAWRDRLREKLDTMRNLERIAPTAPSRRDDAEKELALHEEALRRIELLIAGIGPDSQSWPVGALHVDPWKGQRTELRVCAVYFGPGKWAILDWTAPVDRRFSDRWEGETFPECEKAWTSWWSSRYPKGRIEYSYDIAGFPQARDKHFDCSGSTLGDDLILAGALLGAALMIAVPVFGLGAAVLASGITSTVASAGYSIFDRHRDGIRDWRSDAFDVLAIVSCSAGGLAAAGRFGVGARVLSGGKVFRALVATDVVATSAEALLMTESTFEAIRDYAQNEKKTPAERLALIAGLVQTAAAGTFAYLNVRAAVGDLQLKPQVAEQLSVEEKFAALRDPAGELHISESPKLEGHTETGVHETKVDIDAERQRTPAKAVAAVKTRVTDMVPGLYASIGRNMEVPGWQFFDTLKPREVTTDFVAPNGARGRVVRHFDGQTLVLYSAFLNDAPSWMQHGGIAMDASRGTPTIAYLTMRQMHLFEIPLGGCKRFKMSSIQNIRAIAELERLTRGGMSAKEAVRKTHSVRYAETTIVQSGHVVVDVDIEGGSRAPFQGLLLYYEGGDPTRRAAHNKQLKQNGVERTDEVLADYDIHIQTDKLRLEDE